MGMYEGSTAGFISASAEGPFHSPPLSPSHRPRVILIHNSIALQSQATQVGYWRVLSMIWQKEKEGVLKVSGQWSWAVSLARRLGDQPSDHPRLVTGSAATSPAIVARYRYGQVLYHSSRHHPTLMPSNWHYCILCRSIRSMYGVQLRPRKPQALGPGQESPGHGLLLKLP